MMIASWHRRAGVVAPYEITGDPAAANVTFPVIANPQAGAS